MIKHEFTQVTVGVGSWPTHMDRKQQKVIVLGLAAADRGVSIGRLQEALLASVDLSKTAPVVGGETSKGDTRKGRGYVDQWFTPSWVPKDCIVEKSVTYDYCIPTSRIRLVPKTKFAASQLLIARITVENLCLS